MGTVISCIWNDKQDKFLDNKKEVVSNESNILLDSDIIISINGVKISHSKSSYIPSGRHVSCYSEKFNQYLSENDFFNTRKKCEVYICFEMDQSYIREKFPDIKLVHVRGYF